MDNLPGGVTDAMIDAQWGEGPEGHDEGCDGDFCDCEERAAEEARADRMIEQWEDSRW